MADSIQSLVLLKSQAPAVPPGLVRRRRLEDRLSEGTSKPFTLVSAGPGSGKTLAVAAWIGAGHAPGPVAWLSLDVTDNDPATFWTDLLQSLLGSGGIPKGNSLWDIIPAASFGVVEAREVRTRLAELTSPVVLVLDDFHEITGEQVLEAFGQLVDHLPENVRLVLLSRADPMLRLHRLRVSGQLTEVRTSDLAFTEPETAELFDLQGIHLQKDQLGVLRSRTQGWPAGLRLAAMSLDPTDVDGGIARFSGNERSVADYLVGEVIDRLSAEDRDFLLKTSITEKVNGNLADFLMNRTDSQFTLEKLVGANAFVVAIGGQNEWFAYHPLMRELLRHRLSLEQPRALPQLHERAAGWMAQQGEPIESIRHSILAGDLQGAGRTLLSVVPRILSFEGSALAAAIEPLARTAIDRPDLCSLLASGTVHFHRWEMQAMMQDVAEAREYLDESDPDLVPSAEVLMLLFEIAAARQHGDGEAVVSAANRVISFLDRTPRRLIPAGRPFRVIAEVNLGGGQLWTGDLDAAEQMLALSGPAALQLGLPLPNLNAIGHHAVVEALQGRCRQAHRRGLEGMQRHRTPWLGVRTAGRRLVPGVRTGGAGAAPTCRGGDPDQPGAGRRRRAVGPVDPAGAGRRGRTARGAPRGRRGCPGCGCAAAGRPCADPTPGRPDRPLGRDRRRGGAAPGRSPAEAVSRIGKPGDDVGFAASWERVTLARARLALGQHGAGR